MKIRWNDPGRHYVLAGAASNYLAVAHFWRSLRLRAKSEGGDSGLKLRARYSVRNRAWAFLFVRPRHG